MKNDLNAVNAWEKNIRTSTSQSHKRVKGKDLLLVALSNTNFSDKIYHFSDKKPSSVNRNSSINQRKKISLKS